MWALNTVLIGQNINLTVRDLSDKFCLFLELNTKGVHAHWEHFS